MKVSITSLLRDQKYAAIVIVVLVVLSIVGIWNFLKGPTKEIIDIEEKIQETVTLAPLENIAIVLSPFKYESLKEFWEYYWIGLEEFLLNRTINIEISTKNDVYICLRYSYTCDEMFKSNYYSATFVVAKHPWSSYLLTIINMNESNTINIKIVDSYKFIKPKFEYAFIWFYIAVACILLILIVQYLTKLTIDELETKILTKLFSEYRHVKQRPWRTHISILISYIVLTAGITVVALQRVVLDTLKGPILKNLTLDYLYRIYIIFAIYIIIVFLSLITTATIYYILTRPIDRKIHAVTELRNFDKNLVSLFFKSFKSFRMLLVFIALVIIIIIYFLYSSIEENRISQPIIMSLLLGPYFGFLLSRSFLKLQKPQRHFYFIHVKILFSSTVIIFLFFTSLLDVSISLFSPLLDYILSGSVISSAKEIVMFPTTFDFINLAKYVNIFYALGSLPLISIYYFFLIFTIFLPQRSLVSANEGKNTNKRMLKYELKSVFMDDLINDFVFPALIFLVSIWLQYYITGPLEWGDVAVSFLISFIAGFFANYLQGLRQGQGCRE